MDFFRLKTESSLRACGLVVNCVSEVTELIGEPTCMRVGLLMLCLLKDTDSRAYVYAGWLRQIIFITHVIKSSLRVCGLVGSITFSAFKCGSRAYVYADWLVNEIVNHGLQKSSLRVCGLNTYIN